MDDVVSRALEEICSQGTTGLTLPNLWPKIQTHLSSNGLPLCTNVKQALWSSLLGIPTLRFESNGVLYDAEDPNIQSVEVSEAMELRIVASEQMFDNFVGIYDIKASDSGVSEVGRRVLERLAIARTDGITQNELAKEFGIKNNNIFYILRGLESRGLIARQSTIVRKKEAGNGEYKVGSIVNTNMLYLYRYAKHLGHLKRLEITKEGKASADNDNADIEVATGDGVSEEHIKDYVPDITAICDRLEKADGKVLVASDIKKELGYLKTHGHRKWRNILQRMKDARLVEEFFATVNKKEVCCLRLLKKFSLTTCVPKSHGVEDDDLDTEQVKPVKRGQITDQLMELPIEQQIYDLIDAEGSNGLTLNEVYKRLGINNKRYYPRILEMVSRFGMHLDSESLNRGVVYRAWTSGNYNTGVSNTTIGKVEDTMDKSSTHAQAGQLMLPYTIEDVDVGTLNIDAEAREEQNINDPLLDLRSSNNLQSEANGILPDAELQISNVKPASDTVSLDLSSSASPAPRVRRSYTTYPCLGLNSVNSLREQRILEKLQEEKILIRPELQRLLESLENLEKKHAVQMDRKTLERSLNKLQEDGHCKCISFAVPSVTNCGRRRTIDVIIHPSEYKAEDLSDRVHDKLRSFERQIRAQSSRLKSSKGKSIPVLDGVERISTNVKENVQQENFEAMKNNGFVLAKMVRAKLLHIFLWGYLTGLADWDDAILGQPGYQQKNPHSTCKLFELDAAIKAMPLELFLQVAGSAVKLENVVEKCKNGLRLSDLPIHEYRCLMDTRATARFSYLIDILRRLKLIRLIGGELLEAPVGPHATLRHSLEFKPYIEEPVGMFLPSTGVNSFDLRPHVRHDFVLASRKGVDEYWNTLEYCYAASDPKAAFHAFPGSAVHEVFLIRSWASARVMTAQQRAELSKLVANEDINKKITYKRCEKIAEKLNLTLEQVLRVFYDKRQKHKLKLASSAKEQDFQLPTHALLSYKRKRSLKEKSVNNESPLDEESGKLKQAKILSAEDATEEQSSAQKSLEYHETHILINEMDGQKELEDDPEPTEDEGGHSYSDIHDRAMSELQSSCQKRFSWTANKDRLLVIEYVKYRAARGSKFNRTDWTSLQSLPGPPATCKRRMSTLNRNKQFRKAVMKLCNMLSVRYAKHLEISKNKSLGDGCSVIIQDQNAPELVNHTKDFYIEERWDDFDNKDIKMLLDEVLKYKQIAKIEATKGARYISKYPHSDVGGDGHELDENTLGSSATPISEIKKDSGRRQASSRKRRQTSSRKSRRRLPKSYVMLMNQVQNSGTQAYKSVAVSNAIELFKLVFLSSAKGPEVPNMLAETLRRYSEHDLFTAFNYLRDKNFMVMGSGISQFVLSQQFLHNISLSPFPVNTGKKAAKMVRWLQEKENDLLENGVDLSADLQCGDVLQLCVLMCSGEISMFPCLPDEGVGEIEDLKKRKFDDNEIYSRKEKGFPGINLSLSSDIIPRVDVIALSRDENAVTSRSNLEYRSLPSELIEGTSKSNADSELTWNAMTCYARHLASSAQESSSFSPNLFKTVHSAIQKAGDQGLSMEEISEIIDVHGESMPELLVEVLEAFGSALKVNAYDSIRVVESLYRSKYLLASVATYQHDHDLNTLESRQENHEDGGKDLMKETCTDCIETSTDEAHHRLTILNRPVEVPQPTSEVQRNDETETYEEENVMPLRTDPKEKKFEFGVGDSPSFKPILPWVNGDGTINDIVYKGLVRRVLGIVMQNPGILEEHVLSQMNVLNPQSCRKLLELLILDSHIIVRKMYQSVSSNPPAMLSRLLGCSYKEPKLVCREHLFANPRSIHYL